MLSRDISDYGGQKLDAIAVSNPETQIAASEWNRTAEDQAQLTRTGTRALVSFATTAVAPPVTYAASAVNIRSMWGNGTAQKPTVLKTATGLYTITYPTSFTDALSVVETLGFFDGWVSCRGTDSLDRLDGRLLTISANIATIAVYAAGALANVGNNSAAVFQVTVYLV